MLGRGGRSSRPRVTVLLLVPPGRRQGARGLLYEHESRYQFIQVVQRGDGAAALR